MAKDMCDMQSFIINLSLTQWALSRYLAVERWAYMNVVTVR